MYAVVCWNGGRGAHPNVQLTPTRNLLKMLLTIGVPSFIILYFIRFILDYSDEEIRNSDARRAKVFPFLGLKFDKHPMRS